MKFESVKDIINYAMDKEKEAAEFYDKAKDDKNYEALNDMLSDFAKEEVKHYEMLRNIGKDHSKIESYTFKNIADLKISDYMTEITYKPGLSYQDLLHVAMKREEEAFKFYQGLLEKTDSADLKKIFKILAQEESKHKLKLETWYDDFLAKQDM
ncbi:MAG: ferritin family protein [Proteobacteria bacterium]|nr:ferritin family protein [Pseudomonadota bacterium]